MAENSTTLEDQPIENSFENPLASSKIDSASQRQLLIGIALLLVFVVGLFFPGPVGVDWKETFRPAAREFIQLDTPYYKTESGGYFNPPWALLPIIPMAIIPDPVGTALYFTLNFSLFAVTAYLLSKKMGPAIAFMLSPMVMHSLLNGNIDSLVIIGFVMPPQIGLFFILIKPQIGGGVALFWLVGSWRQKGFKEVVRVFAPVTVAFLFSFVVYGLWIEGSSSNLGLWWNASLFPYSIPLGLFLIYQSLKTRRVEYAMPAAAFLSPYILLHAYAGALAGTLKVPRLTAIIVSVFWIFILLRLIFG